MNTKPRSISSETSRRFDLHVVDAIKIPSLLLMENAGRGAADVMTREGISGPVVICCGAGNNGGDGLVVARHLVVRGKNVKILLLAEPSQLSSDAAVQWRIIENMNMNRVVLRGSEMALALPSHFSGAEWIVDGLFGTGLKGPVRAPFDSVIGMINKQEAKILALDIPSGLDGDSGKAMGAAIEATHTVTFLAPKLGFTVPGAARHLGHIHVADIGIPLGDFDLP